MRELRRNNSTNKVHPINTSRCFSSILDHLICSTNLPQSPPGHHHPRRIAPATTDLPLINSSSISSNITLSGSVPNSVIISPSPASVTTSAPQHHRHKTTSSSNSDLAAQTPGLVARLMGLESLPPDGSTSALNLRSRSLNSLNLLPDSLHRTSLLSRSSSSSHHHHHQQQPNDPHHRHHHRRVQSTSSTSIIPHARDYKLQELFALTEDPPVRSSLPSPSSQKGGEFSFCTVAAQTQTVTSGGEREAMTRRISRNDNNVIRDYEMMRKNEEDYFKMKMKKKNIIMYNKKKVMETIPEATAAAARRVKKLNTEDNNTPSCHGSRSSSKPPTNGRQTEAKASHRLIKVKKKTREMNNAKEVIMGHVGRVIAPVTTTMRKNNNRVVHCDDDYDQPYALVNKQSTDNSNIDQTQKSPVSVLDHQTVFEFDLLSSPVDKTNRMLTFNHPTATPPPTRSRKGKKPLCWRESDVINSPPRVPNPKEGHSSFGEFNQQEAPARNDHHSTTEKKKKSKGQLLAMESEEEFVKVLTTMCDLAAHEFIKDIDWSIGVGANRNAKNNTILAMPNKADNSCVAELCADISQGVFTVLLDQLLYELVS